MTNISLNLDIDADQFRAGLVSFLNVGVRDLHSVIHSLVTEGIAKSLDSHVQMGTCIGYTFRNGNQSNILTVQSAIDSGGFDFWYLTIQIDMQHGTILEETSVLAPKFMEWIPIRYGGGIERQFKFKHTKIKTRERYIIELLHPLVPSTLFTHVPAVLNCKGYCAVKHLSPVPLGVYEWWQPFLCVLCGKTYFCQCFQDAIEKHTLYVSNLPKSQKGTLAHNFLNTTAKARYRPEICHLCAGAPSDLFYCSPMYGSQIMVRYGAYIQKISIEKSISERDAENEVREHLGVPRIGEGWVSETQLYKLVVCMFTDYEVIREASPDWLGNQRLDIYIPSLNLAIEYQGEQHFKPIALFGGVEGLRKTQERDRRKKHLCQKNKIKLVFFKYNESLNQENVERRLKNLLPGG